MPVTKENWTIDCMQFIFEICKSFDKLTVNN